jgi:hypothetical protein
MHATPFEALQRMRELSDCGVSFSFSFQSLSLKRKQTDGIKHAQRAQFRKGLRDNQSDLSHQLIAYIDLEQGSKPKFFHLPLLLTFNEYIIKP